jgi:hypothetical protein
MRAGDEFLQGSIGFGGVQHRGQLRCERSPHGIAAREQCWDHLHEVRMAARKGAQCSFDTLNVL